MFLTDLVDNIFEVYFATGCQDPKGQHGILTQVSTWMESLGIVCSVKYSMPCVFRELPKKLSHIRETLNLLTDADSSIDTKTDRNGQF